MPESHQPHTNQTNMESLNEANLKSSEICNFDFEEQKQDQEIEVFDYAKRAQWLRTAVLGANDGLLSTASLIMGVGEIKMDFKIMLLTGIVGLVAGACSMTIGEFVSVYSQYDIEVTQLKRAGKDARKKKLSGPFQAAVASPRSPLLLAANTVVSLPAAAFLKDYKMRLWVVVATVSLALLVVVLVQF